VGWIQNIGEDFRIQVAVKNFNSKSGNVLQTKRTLQVLICELDFKKGYSHSFVNMTRTFPALPKQSMTIHQQETLLRLEAFRLRRIIHRTYVCLKLIAWWRRIENVCWNEKIVFWQQLNVSQTSNVVQVHG